MELLQLLLFLQFIPKKLLENLYMKDLNLESILSLKEEKVAKFFFATFKQKFRRMKCRGNLKLQTAERKEKNPFKNAQNPH